MRLEAVLDVTTKWEQCHLFRKTMKGMHGKRTKSLELNLSHLSGKITRKRREVASLCKTLDSAK